MAKRKKRLPAFICVTIIAAVCLSRAAFAETTDDTGQRIDIAKTASTNTAKARTVITTDGAVDDMNSVIRFLYYANEMDLEGIVLTSSVYHYAGDAAIGIEAFRSLLMHIRKFIPICQSMSSATRLCRKNRLGYYQQLCRCQSQSHCPSK